MANINERKNKNGIVISYKIRVFKCNDKKGNPQFYYKTVKNNPHWTESKRQKELNKIATLFEQECKNGFAVDNRQSFGKYAEYVLDIKEKNEKKKHRTIKRYRELLDRINHAIGHLKLSDIKPQHLNKFYEQLSLNGMNLKTGGYLSDKTILEHHRLIHTILNHAEKEMIVQYNAASKATPPKNKKTEANYLEIEEIIRILHLVKNEPLKWQVVLNLLAFTGGRRGEIAGIKVNKINYENNTIEFSETLLYASDIGIYKDTTKNEYSNRILTIPNEIMVLIKKLVNQLKKNQLKYGDMWNNTGYLLTKEDGNPMHPDSITGYCSDFRKKYNNKILEDPKNKDIDIQELNKLLIPKMNPHSFRHSQASVLFYLGADIVSISRRLGHANPTTTSNVYSHLFKKADEKTSQIIADVFMPKRNLSKTCPKRKKTSE